MEALLVVINVFLVLVALVLIVVVLLQQGNTANLGAISGGAETFFGKNKAKSYEGKLLLITKICATVFIVLAILATALTARLNRAGAQTPTTAEQMPVEDQVDEPADEAPIADATEAPAAEATDEPVATDVPAATDAPVDESADDDAA